MPDRILKGGLQGYPICDVHGDLIIDYPGWSDLFPHQGPRGKVHDYGHEARYIACSECPACDGADNNDDFHGPLLPWVVSADRMQD